MAEKKDILRKACELKQHTTLPSQLEGNTLKQEGEQWVWVRASERMPELYPVNNTEQLHFELDGRKVDGYFLHSRCFEYFNNEIAGYSQIDFDDFARIEWLERHPSQPLGGYTLQQVGDAYEAGNKIGLAGYSMKSKHAEYDKATYLSTLTAPIPAEREGEDAVKLKQAVELIQHFVDKVDAGWIRSVDTYNKFKQYLSNLK